MVNESLDIFKSESDTPEVQILIKESIANTYRAWQMLDEKSKTLLTWKYKLEMSDVEIASKLGIKPNSVRMRLTRARNSFKQQLRKLESGPPAKSETCEGPKGVPNGLPTAYSPME